MITGSIVALVTPMLADGQLDLVCFRSLIDHHVHAGSRGLVVVGTTGESPTITFEEHFELIQVAVAHAAGRIPIIAGTGANSTQEAIELSQHAAKVGATATLSVAPYYNKPTQEGLYQHFRAIAEAVNIPMILYNVPSRTVADLHNDTILRLTEIEQVIGIKDATGNMERVTDLLMRIPEDFMCYSGDDMTALPFLMLGGHGVISVTANVAPQLMQKMYDAVQSNDFKQARLLNQRLFKLNRDLFCEANPIPVKWALSQLKMIRGYLRLPLTPLNQVYHARISEALGAADINLS